ncbi:zinc ribbon domain-containing protein [Pseudonocardia parietis]|uniref:Uncharacterized protein n=1 Tax=Pseudonocardia parietis TaxID=570936 RepID=A0ABS4W6L4_9PSEU|nr:zinc ribbon domain-containing protein [Pseudonocardia parietis]MBP2371849.1 hypothetical protein [Pseudonocardia parietis]
MTTDERESSRAVCATCSYVNDIGDRFCGRCGRSTGASVPPRAEPSRRQVDFSTRYLSAAAQLDPKFAEAAIAESLVERTRAIAPSPGISSATVLREAVAARARRRLRDAILVALVVAVFVTSAQAAMVWLVLASVGVTVFGMTGRTRRWPVIVAGVLAVVVLVPLVLIGTGLVPVDGVDQQFGNTRQVVVLLFLAAGVAAVCLVDEALVESLVRDRFRPSTFAPAVVLPSGWERTVRMFGTRRWEGALGRVAEADERYRRAHDEADVIVYRERIPFVGSGPVVDDKIVALPLTPGTAPDGTRLVPRPFAASDLHAHVAAVVGELRDSVALAPSRRLSAMTIREQVLISAERLVTNLHRQPQAAVLPDVAGPPVTHLRLADVRHLADRPEEWIRYHRCFRVEAWDHDLATSTYFTAGTDARMLYLEWTHCVLYPIKERYREIDRTPQFGAVLRGLGVAFVLPVTLGERARRVVHYFRRMPQRPGDLVPAKYGAGRSLRELGSDPGAQDFFQDADAVRYVGIIERAVYRAVGRFLEDRGYSVVDFMEVAKASITNNTVAVSGGTFAGGLSVGIGTVTQQNNQGENSPRGRKKP